MVTGWALLEILFLDVNINKFSPMTASSFISLPKDIQAKRAVLNIVNNDNKCFAYAVNAALFQPSGNPIRVASYPPITTVLRFDGIDFPVKLVDICKFEELNNISINVFGLETVFVDGQYSSRVVGPLYFTKFKRNTHVNLLYVQDDDGNSHYCLIKNLSRLVSKQKSNRHGQLFICDGCLQFFTTQIALNRHIQKDCNYICTNLPSNKLIINKFGDSIPENILQFTNFQKQLKLPFVIYADFESVLKPIQYVEPNDISSFTVKTFEHIPFAFCFYIKCSFDDSLSELVQYRGPDAAQLFVDSLEVYAVRLYHNYLKNSKKMMPLTAEEEEQFQNCNICHICDKVILENEVKVKDHCHISGLYHSAAHSVI